MTAATAQPTAPGPEAVPWRDDARIIALVGLAHGTSHFFHMLLPPLFPAFIRDFGLSYSQLGLLVTLFFAISSVGQASAGFLVDRVGARPVLFCALALFALASVAASLAQGYGGLMLAAALAGLGNSPFHPVDFTILNHRVSPPRLGHAFSAHGISGSLGWAAAPVFMVGVAAWSGDWRWAYVGSAVWAVVVLLLLLWQRDAVDDKVLPPWRAQAAAQAAAQRAAVAAGAPDEHPFAFLRLPAVWLCFAFFFWSTAALAAIQSFASPALGRIYGLPLEATAFVVTGFMLSSAAGAVAGGFLVGRTARLEATIAASMAIAVALLLLAGSGWLPGAVAALLTALAGVGTGLASPSRDMLIKRASPPGATGRVYGTVYSGLDVGFAISAPIFGWLLDHGQPRAVLLGAALALSMGILSAAVIGMRVAKPAAVPGRA